VIGKKTSVYITANIEKQIMQRGDNRSGIINRDLERYYTVLDRALRTVSLTENEALLIVDVLNGSILDTLSVRMLWAGVEDAINLDKVDEKWGINGAALVEKLRSLGEIQCLAVVDAAERFWADEDNRNMDTRETIKNYFPNLESQ